MHGIGNKEFVAIDAGRAAKGVSRRVGRFVYVVCDDAFVQHVGFQGLAFYEAVVGRGVFAANIHMGVHGQF